MLMKIPAPKTPVVTCSFFQQDVLTTLKPVFLAKCHCSVEEKPGTGLTDSNTRADLVKRGSGTESHDGVFFSAGHPGEELHPQLPDKRLAERSLQPCEVGRGAERQEDDAAGRRDLGRNPAGRTGPMTATAATLPRCSHSIYIAADFLALIYVLKDCFLYSYNCTLFFKKILKKKKRTMKERNGTNENIVG